MTLDGSRIADLIKQLRNGDSTAAENLHNILNSYIVSKAQKWVRFDEAEDIASEVEELIMTEPLGLIPTEPQALCSWIWITTRNKAFERNRVKNTENRHRKIYQDNILDTINDLTEEDKGTELQRMKRRIIQVIDASVFLGSREIRHCFKRLLNGQICGGKVDETLIAETATIASRTKLEINICLKFLASQVIDTKPNQQSDLAKYRKRVLKLLGGYNPRNSILAELHMATLKWPGWPGCSLQTLLKARYAKYLDELRVDLKAHHLFTTVSQLMDILHPPESDDQLQEFRKSWEHWM